MGPPPGQSLVQREVPDPHHSLVAVAGSATSQTQTLHSATFFDMEVLHRRQPWSSRFFVFFLVNVAVSSQEHRIGG